MVGRFHMAIWTVIDNDIDNSYIQYDHDIPVVLGDLLWKEWIEDRWIGKSFDEDICVTGKYWLKLVF